MLSYASAVQFALITDRKLCPDPGKIIERFAPEFETLLLAAMMLPWSEGGRSSPRKAAGKTARR
jgi:hypothetical protein